jgi:hypothetical protein
MTTDYEKQAQDFLKETNTILTVKYNRTGKYFDDDKEVRDIYDITLKRGNREYKFTFGNSINNSGRFINYRTKELSQGTLIKDSPTNKYRMPWDVYKDWVENKNFEIPTAYSILAAITKYDPGTLEDFCNEFGYDTDSRKAEKTYNAVKNEYQNVAMLFNDTEMQELAEIN